MALKSDCLAVVERAFSERRCSKWACRAQPVEGQFLCVIWCVKFVSEMVVESGKKRTNLTQAQ